MKKTALFFCLVLILTLLVILEIKPFEHSYDFFDYINIAFCNTAYYALYNRSNWNVINLLYFLFIQSSGIYFLSEKIYTYSKGFRSMEILRHGNCNNYLSSCQKQNIKQSLLWIIMVIFCVVLSIAFVGVAALYQDSGIINISIGTKLFSLVSYLAKLFLLYNIAEMWLTFLILRQNFEFLLLLFILSFSVIIFIDIIFGFSFITFTLSHMQFVYLLGYILIYSLSFLYIRKKYASKEIW